jgi:hypothetical protein
MHPAISQRHPAAPRPHPTLEPPKDKPDRDRPIIDAATRSKITQKPIHSQNDHSNPVSGSVSVGVKIADVSWHTDHLVGAVVVLAYRCASIREGFSTFGGRC